MNLSIEEKLLTNRHGNGSLNLDFLGCYESIQEIPKPNTDILLNFVMMLYAVVFIVGLFGNSLVIYVVLRYSKMQTVTNMYIFNLAIADEMFLVSVVFVLITFIYKHWLFGRILCKVYLTITSISQFTSTLLLTVMSADRFIAVCHPMSAPKYRTAFLAKFICLTVWTVNNSGCNRVSHSEPNSFLL